MRIAQVMLARGVVEGGGAGGRQEGAGPAQAAKAI